MTKEKPEKQLRILGICKASGFTTYFGLDQTRTLSFYRRQEGPIERSPDDIDKKIQERRIAGDTRCFVAVVEGNREFLDHFLKGLTEPDLVVLVSTNDVLEDLGVTPIDQQWEKGQPQVDLNKFLPGGF